jgi:hypothetical protein
LAAKPRNAENKTMPNKIRINTELAGEETKQSPIRQGQVLPPVRDAGEGRKPGKEVQTEAATRRLKTFGEEYVIGTSAMRSVEPSLRIK